MLPNNSELLFEIREDIAALLAAQQGQEQGPLPERLPCVPLDLKTRFTEALKLNKPDSFKELEDFLLKEGWDALLYRFEEVR